MDDNKWLDGSRALGYTNNNELIKFLRSKFYRLSRSNTRAIIKELITDAKVIDITKITKKYKTIIKNNTNIFDDNGLMHDCSLKGLKEEFDAFLLSIGKELPYYKDDKTMHKLDDKIGNIFQINKYTTYEKMIDVLMKEGGNAEFQYDFDNPDLLCKPPNNTDTLQLCRIQLMQECAKFGFPVEYVYKCPRCGNEVNMLAHEVSSTKTRMKCDGRFYYTGSDGEEKSQMCGMILTPDDNKGIVKDAYLYYINYEDEFDERRTIEAVSFNRIDPGFYECVLFRLLNPQKKEFYHIVEVKTLLNNTFAFPPVEPGINYIVKLVKAFDDFITQQVGIEIYGLYPQKVSLIIQKAISELGYDRVGNIQIVGDASTGKSTVLKYWSFLMNGSLNLSSSGVNISVAGLRGTKVSLSFMGKDQSIIISGHLNRYSSIHIDEAGENRELIVNLKTFLLERNYSYDKAGSSGLFYERRAHINICENLNPGHAEKYKRMVRRVYRDDSTVIEGEDKPVWQETWDLYLPLECYENPYLYSSVKSVRRFFSTSNQFWLDGYDIALHDRFPFYFYLVKEKPLLEINSIIQNNIYKRDKISDNLEIMKRLKCQDINNFFKGLKKYKHSDHDMIDVDKIDRILEEYNLNTDVRKKEFYYTIVKVSRILNQRDRITNQDLDLLRWIIEKTNCKLDVADTANFVVRGPPDVKQIKEKEITIEGRTKKSNTFDLPDDFN